MKKITYLLIIFVLTSLSTFAQKKPTNPPIIKTETFELNNVIAKVNESIIEATKRIDDSKQINTEEQNSLKITDAEITFQTIYDISGGGEFKLFARASKKWELEKTTTMTFSYSTVKNLTSEKNFIKETFEEHLTKAIVTAAKQWSLSSGTILGLSKEKYNVEVSFMVKKSSGGGIEFEIWGIGADLSVDSENSAVHTVSLTFE